VEFVLHEVRPGLVDDDEFRRFRERSFEALGCCQAGVPTTEHRDAHTNPSAGSGLVLFEARPSSFVVLGESELRRVAG
jgi:hypothetical protein